LVALVLAVAVAGLILAVLEQAAAAAALRITVEYMVAVLVTHVVPVHELVAGEV
jgi:hypothetical protein